jgi:2-polyprenyl-3-methyl-5-hydroxy-6-metoxy-1,4-benzoquinol methylase
MEVSLYAGQPFPFTAEWYKTREHAPHAEQGIHQSRMQAVVKMANLFLSEHACRGVVDLGAGDGGMLQMLQDSQRIHRVHFWGYDLQENNVDHARYVRNVDVRYKDFVEEPIEWADLTLITECLEHLENPHGMVQRIGENSKAIIASSPARETAESHDACHAWCWDEIGYRSLIEQGGFTVMNHQLVEGEYSFQVILGVKP